MRDGRIGASERSLISPEAGAAVEAERERPRSRRRGEKRRIIYAAAHVVAAAGRTTRRRRRRKPPSSSPLPQSVTTERALSFRGLLHILHTRESERRTPPPRQRTRANIKILDQTSESGECRRMYCTVINIIFPCLTWRLFTCGKAADRLRQIQAVQEVVLLFACTCHSYTQVTG